MAKILNYAKRKQYRSSWTLLPIAILFLVTNYCHNNHLADVLENPGGGETHLGIGGLTANDRYIFVGSTQTDGSMAQLVAATSGTCSGTGLSAADCYCQYMASSNGMAPNGEIYIAWLSLGISASTQLDMTCRLKGQASGIQCSIPAGGPKWLNKGNQIVANGYAELFGAVFQSPVQYSETGTSISSTSIFTGTSANGEAVGSACGSGQDWSNASSGSPTMGDSSSTTGTWTAYGTGMCNTLANYIYCIGRP